MKKRLIAFTLACVFGAAAYSQAPDTIYHSKELSLMRMTDFVYLYSSRKNIDDASQLSANGIMIVISNQAVLVELPWDDEHVKSLTGLIRDSLKSQLLMAIVTNAQNDRIGGINLLKEADIPVYALESTTLLAKAANIPRPDIIFEDTLALYFGGHELLLYFPGPGYCSDNLLLWMPSEKLLFGGSFVRPASETSIKDLKGTVPEAWAASLKKSIRRFGDAYYVIPGTGTPGGTELLDHTLKLVSDQLPKSSPAQDGQRD